MLLLEDFEGLTDGNLYFQSNIGRDPNHSKGWYTGSDPNKNQWQPSPYNTMPIPTRMPMCGSTPAPAA